MSITNTYDYVNLILSHIYKILLATFEALSNV